MDDIPSAVFGALAEREANEPFSSGTGRTSFLSRVARDVEAKGRELPLEREHENIVDSGAEGFTLHEEARIDLTKRIRNAGLSPRQLDLLTLKFQEPELTYQQIAQRRTITEGAVKKTFFDIRKKLERTQSSPK